LRAQGTTASEDVYGDSQAEKRDQEASYSQDAYQYEDHEQTMDRTNQGYGYDMTADGEGEGAEDLSITASKMPPDRAFRPENLRRHPPRR
jgi:hypothetical protein